MAKDKLTVKQERFCQEVVKLGNQSEAYRIAYNTKLMKSETINVKASELMKNGKVSVRVKELRIKIANKAEVTVDKITKGLYEIALEGDKDRVQAYDKLAKIIGAYEKDNKQKVVEEREDYSKLSKEEKRTLLKLKMKARS